MAVNTQAIASSNDFVKLFELATMSDDVLIMCPTGVSWRKLESAFHSKSSQYSNQIEFLRELLITEFNCVRVNETIIQFDETE